MHFLRTVFQIIVLFLFPRFPAHRFAGPLCQHDISLEGGSDSIVVKENSIVTRSFIISSGTCSSLEDNFAVEIIFSKASSIYGRDDCVVRFTNGRCKVSSTPQVCHCGPTARHLTVTRLVGGRSGEMWFLCLITGDYQISECHIFEILVLYDQPKITSLTVTTNSLPVSETSPVTRNATVIVTCVWEVGYPPQTARLTKDGDELSPTRVRHHYDETDRSLRQIDYVIQHAQCSDSGLITCEAAGSAHNKSFMLLVKYDPVITSLTVTTNGFPVNETSPITTNITVTGNTAVTVTCVWEEGCPPQTARLTKDGDELSSASVRHYNEAKRRSLRQTDYVIQHAQCSDSGLITCETAGSAHNKSFMLLVRYDPVITSLTVTTNGFPVNETSPVTTNITVTGNTAVTVTCVWEEGCPPQTARLTKDGDELSSASVRHYNEAKRRSLRQTDYVIQHAQCSDSGLITCETAGSAHNKSFMLLVRYDPVITSLTVTTNGFPVNETSPVTTNITVTGNTAVTVTCVWEEGCPPQTARLTKDRDELSSASVRRYNDAKRRSLRQIDYVIQHSQCSDSGLITCETAGSAHNKSFMLLVRSVATIATKTSWTVSAVTLILVQGIIFFGVMTVFCCEHFRHRISCRRAAPRRSRNVRQDAARAEGVVFRPAPPTVQFSRDSFLGHNNDTNPEGPDDGDQATAGNKQTSPAPPASEIQSDGYLHPIASPVESASSQVATSTPLPLQ